MCGPSPGAAPTPVYGRAMKEWQMNLLFAAALLAIGLLVYWLASTMPVPEPPR